jgi:hypothetical protein
MPARPPPATRRTKASSPVSFIFESNALSQPGEQDLADVAVLRSRILPSRAVAALDLSAIESVLAPSYECYKYNLRL